MSQPIISVENLSKSYLIGHQGTREQYTSLRDTLSQHAKNFTRRTMDTLRGKQMLQGDSVEEFWALKDVSFEVNQGDVLGIIGRNGAGKSTLLKVLSRITEPTSGKVTIRGRIASLLEVGTGFHPELSGRENIFLNGAILGMSRKEIKAKFDEIVDFAGVEKFLDTPVKRYSSGMYVRLAFAVAAHLEPEILVVDEVLAVGDAEFQKKCMGKMKDVAGEGRTVIFVSHSMAAVASLCTRAIILGKGALEFQGNVVNAIEHYLTSKTTSDVRIENCRLTSARETSTQVGFTKICMSLQNERIGYSTDISLEIEVESTIEANELSFAGSIFDQFNSPIGTFFSDDVFDLVSNQKCKFQLILAGLKLAPGIYSFGLSIGQGDQRSRRKDYDIIIGMPRFDIIEVGGKDVVGQWDKNWGSLNLNDFCTVNRNYA
jgi:lipopolysaccharide transport system ATP-binding protein